MEAVRINNIAGMAPVVQRADNSILWINHYPVDKNGLQPIHFVRWIATYPLGKIIRSLNNCGQQNDSHVPTFTIPLTKLAKATKVHAYSTCYSS